MYCKLKVGKNLIAIMIIGIKNKHDSMLFIDHIFLQNECINMEELFITTSYLYSCIVLSHVKEADKINI